MDDPSSLSNNDRTTRPHHEHKPHTSILKKSREPARKKRIVWDEQNIALTESQKDSTMKIEEPKTPYHYYDSSEDDEEMAATRARDLEDAVGKITPFSPGQSNTSLPLSPMAPHNFPFLANTLATSEDDSESSEKESGVEWAESDESGKDEDSAASQRQFADKRRSHYNEYEMMKRLRENLKLKTKAQQEEEDEEDEMEGDKNEGKRPHPHRPLTTTTTTTTTTTSTTPSEDHTELPHKSNHNHHAHHTHHNHHDHHSHSSKTNHDTTDKNE